MGIISESLHSIGSLSMQIISFFGYFGVFILMAGESMIVPIPSELVMPFAGFLSATGHLNFFIVILVSSLGSIAGSLISYWMGHKGGNRLVMHFGKYLLLDVEDLKKTEKWFKHSGEKTVLISRFIPIVRHFISIPAGIGKMNLKKFIIYTLIGATIWNTFLAYLGYLLGANWELVKAYSEYFTIPVAILLVIGGSFFAYRFLRHKLKK
jgi:membrane protein DedA with SNARE-associated domain